MPKLNLADVTKYVEDNISTFHTKRIDSLKKLKLKTVLKKKNPYLFKAKYILTADEIIKSITDAFISSNEETIFGDWLEGLALFINDKVYGGSKSTTTGIDLEFTDAAGIRYIVAIKSGPNWGNSSQVAKMKTDFEKASRTLKTSNSKLNVIAVNGCCYGADANPNKGHYFKYCGQDFWEFISADKDLYTQLVEPLGHLAKERNDDFMVSYASMQNRFIREFTTDFCKASGEIDWEKLVKFNSAKKLPKVKKAPGPKAVVKPK